LNTQIDYQHASSESILSKIMKVVLRLARVKTVIQRDLASGKIDQAVAKLPKSLTQNYDVDVSETLGRKFWTISHRGKPSQQTVFFLHGGAYIYGITGFYWQFVARLMKQSEAQVVVADYPLAPQATYAEAYDYVDAVYQRLLETTSPDDIILMGDSAGAGLALGFAQHLRNDKGPLPQQLILLAPWLDITMGNPDMQAVDNHDVMLSIEGLQQAGKAYAGMLDPKDYKVSPLYGDFEGLPPMSVFIGTHDLFIADVRKLKDKMRSANLSLNYFEYPKMIHDWIVVANFKETQYAIGQIADLIKS
jgi:acetyl esterase/lipase